MKRIAAGIDVGGTNSAFGFVDSDGNIIASGNIKTDISDDFDVYLNLLISEINNVFSTIKGDYEIAGYGIGAPNGNYFHGTIENAPNLRWKGKIEFTKNLSAITGKPAFLTNDANAAAIGEKIFGKAKDLNDFVVITLGTGLGSGIYCGGKLLYGSTSQAGEVGHIIVEKNGRLCGCGRKGCLEKYASATGIKLTAHELLKNSNRKSLLRNYPENEIGSKLIYECAVKGDELALECFDFTGEILGRALANVTAVLSPEAIFLFGGLALAGDIIFNPVRKYCEENLLNIFKGTVKIEKSGLKENSAAILGAAALFFSESGV